MKNAGTIFVVAMVIGVLAFFGGMKYQESKSPSLEGGANAPQIGVTGGKVLMGPDGPGKDVAMMKGGPTSGEVISIDDNTLTLKLSDGSSKIITLSDTTEFSKNATAVRTDLKEGEQITIFGETNSDGSVSAKAIQLGASLRIMKGPEKGMVEKSN